MLSYNERLLFYLLRIGLGTETKYDFMFSEKPNWKFIFKMSAEHGILAIVFDGLEYLINNGLIDEAMQPSRSTKMQWALNVMKIENVYGMQYHLANELVDVYANEGIKTVVLKGIALAELYPKSNHRPCGDLDCFLMGEFVKGNTIAHNLGAHVDLNHYKHSHILYKGFEIENHQFCTAIRGSKKAKKFESYLQHLLMDEELISINKGNLLAPCPLFNALFLTIHSWNHFLTEGIKLRHISDWAILMANHVNDIDWEEFKNKIQIRDKKMLSFAECISIISHKYFGSPLPVIFANSNMPDLEEKLINSILYDNDTIFNKHYSKWKTKYMLVKNALLSNWKYQSFSEDSSLLHTLRSILGFFFERNPKL